jgi:hypothetical protein
MVVEHTDIAALADAGVLSLADQAAAQLHLPDFRARIAALDPVTRSQVLAACPSPLAVEYAATVLREARGFRAAEVAFANVVLPAAGFLDVAQLREVLTAWASNDQCVFAGAMPDNAVHLFQATRSLLPASLPDWEQFGQSVASQAVERGWPYYEYPSLVRVVQAETGR